MCLNTVICQKGNTNSKMLQEITYCQQALLITDSQHVLLMHPNPLNRLQHFLKCRPRQTLILVPTMSIIMFITIILYSLKDIPLLLKENKKEVGTLLYQ